MPSAPGVRRTRRASAERAGTLPSFAHVMPYTAEGETIAPAVLQGAEWKTIVSKRHEEFYQRERREAAERRALNALLQPTDSASSPADKAHNNGKYVISRKKTAERKKRPPIPRLPRDDRKIVVRPRNLNLRTIPPGILLATVCAQLNLPMPVIRNEDQLRINPYNNTFTISTPSDERAQLYLNLPGIRINDVDHPVMAYLPAPDNAVRGVIYGALGDESAEEIIELCTIENPKLQILSARRMGQSRAMVITFASTKLPRIVKFQCMPFNCFPFRERVETCYNCRRTGHRADVCYQPQTQRCRRCGEEHPPPPEGELPSCEARCIICDGVHATGSRNCKQRFITKPKKALPSLPPPTTTSNRYLLLSSDDDDEDEKDCRDHSEKKEKSRSHRSRTRRRSASRGHSSSRSRDRSASFPPLEEMKKGGSNQSGGRSGNSKTSNSHDNKSEKTSRSRSSSTSSKKADKQVSWAARASHAHARERELLEYKAINKKLLDTIAQMQKAKVEKAENQNSPPKFAPLTPPQ